MKRLAITMISTIALFAIVPQANADFWSRARDGVVKVAKGSVKVVTKPMTIIPEVIVDTTKGKDIGKSLQNHAHQYLDGHKDIARGTADIHTEVSKETRKIVREVGGDVAGDAVDFALEGQDRLVEDSAGAVSAGVELAKGKGLVSIPAEMLAAELRQAESTVLPESKPLPRHVIEEMSKIYPDSVLKHARYVVGSKISTNVAEMLNRAVRIGENSANAVTVGRVIVFERQPGKDYGWWAHELGHVQQYMEMGIDGFARAYVKNRDGIERDADRRGGLVS